MKNDDSIKDKKVHYDINREAAKISALLSDKIEKFYITGKEILLLGWSRLIEQARFTYFPFGKALAKTNKNQSKNKKNINY